MTWFEVTGHHGNIHGNISREISANPCNKSNGSEAVRRTLLSEAQRPGIPRKPQKGTAKPLFAGSIPAGASLCGNDLQSNG